MLTSERETEIKQKIFSALKLFTNFHKNRRLAEECVVDKIKSKRKY